MRSLSAGKDECSKRQTTIICFSSLLCRNLAQWPAPAYLGWANVWGLDLRDMTLFTVCISFTKRQYTSWVFFSMHRRINWKKKSCNCSKLIFAAILCVTHTRWQNFYNLLTPPKGPSSEVVPSGCRCKQIPLDLKRGWGKCAVLWNADRGDFGPSCAVWYNWSQNTSEEAAE